MRLALGAAIVVRISTIASTCICRLGCRGFLSFVLIGAGKTSTVNVEAQGCWHLCQLPSLLLLLLLYLGTTVLY